MGLSHYRKGPNKVFIFGLSQPISDAIKLLVKDFLKFSYSKVFMFFLGPLSSLLVMLLCWIFFWGSNSLSCSQITFMLIVSLMCLAGYGFILTSWGSNSKYSLLGGYRSVSQIISYEVCLVFFILVVIYLACSFSFSLFNILQDYLWFGASFYVFFFFWLLLCLAESNRTPFDLTEGESEIVSGFNIEYGGGLFAFIFIREYGMIMYLGFITSLFFLGGCGFVLKIFLISLFFVWCRCSFPRVRYDILIICCWKIFLPYVLRVLIIF